MVFGHSSIYKRKRDDHEQIIVFLLLCVEVTNLRLYNEEVLEEIIWGKWYPTWYIFSNEKWIH